MKPLAYVYSCRNPGQVALLWAHQPAPFGHGWIDVKAEPLVRLSEVEGKIKRLKSLLNDAYGRSDIKDEQVVSPSEVEALRKDAERYRWLRDHSGSIHQFYLSTPIYFTGVKFNKENVDNTIDAAIAAQGVTP